LLLSILIGIAQRAARCGGWVRERQRGATGLGERVGGSRLESVPMAAAFGLRCYSLSPLLAMKAAPRWRGVLIMMWSPWPLCAVAAGCGRCLGTRSVAAAMTQAPMAAAFGLRLMAQ